MFNMCKKNLLFNLLLKTISWYGAPALHKFKIEAYVHGCFQTHLLRWIREEMDNFTFIEVHCFGGMF